MPEAAANVNETSALPDDIRESVAVSNLKAIGDAPGVLQNMATANAVAFQHAMNQITLAATAKAIDAINRASVESAGLINAVTSIISKLAGETITPKA